VSSSVAGSLVSIEQAVGEAGKGGTASSGLSTMEKEPEKITLQPIYIEKRTSNIR
jgi:hypothetical protein